MSRSYGDRERIARPEIDGLSVITAAQTIVRFCIAHPDRVEPEYTVTELDPDGLFAAIETKRAPDTAAPPEFWVTRVRLAQAPSPFDTSAGIEIRLPDGFKRNTTEPQDLSGYSRPVRYDEGVFVSFPHAGSQWRGRPIHQQDFTWDGTTVGAIDDVIELGEDRGDINQWAGLYLADAIAGIV